MNKVGILAAVVLLIFVGCKKDKKSSPKQDVIIDKRITHPSDKRVHSFTSDVKDLRLLYQSDAWNMVQQDGRKIGLAQVQVAKLEGTYFLAYALTSDKIRNFSALMDVLPSFKNFREMSQAITGVPLNYGEQLSCIYDMKPNFNLQSDTTNTDKPIYNRMVLRLDLNKKDTYKNTYSAIFENQAVVTQATKYLMSIGVQDFEFFSSHKQAFLIITVNPEVINPKDLKIQWDNILQDEELQHLRNTYPDLAIDRPFLEGWRMMELL